MAQSVESIEKSQTYKWTVKLYEERGLCMLGWGTNAPFRAQQGKVCLYEGSFPGNPESAASWQWDDQPPPFATGKLWGTGWCAAQIAQKPSNGPYIYATQTPISALTAGPVTAERAYTWRLRLFNTGGSGSQGNRCAMEWSTDAPFRAQQGRICLYEGSFPSDPTAAKEWTWDDAKQPFVTNQHWGPGWCAAYIAQKGSNGPYVYLLQTEITRE
jgi:hypothetical protein